MSNKTETTYQKIEKATNKVVKFIVYAFFGIIAVSVLMTAILAPSDEEMAASAVVEHEKNVAVVKARIDAIRAAVKAEKDRISALTPEQLSIEISGLKQKVRKIPVEKYSQNLFIYKKLGNLDPTNAKYKSKIAFYSGKIAEQKRMADRKAKEQSALKIRAEKIKKQFSGWDGSNIYAERVLKASLNDPASYDHVSTRYEDNGSNVIVYTKFRARNGFGGLVLKSAVVEVSYSGSTASVVTVF